MKLERQGPSNRLLGRADVDVDARAAACRCRPSLQRAAPTPR